MSVCLCFNYFGVPPPYRKNDKVEVNLLPIQRKKRTLQIKSDIINSFFYSEKIFTQVCTKIKS